MAISNLTIQKEFAAILNPFFSSVEDDQGWLAGIWRPEKSADLSSGIGRSVRPQNQAAD